MHNTGDSPSIVAKNLVSYSWDLGIVCPWHSYHLPRCSATLGGWLPPGVEKPLGKGQGPPRAMLARATWQTSTRAPPMLQDM